MIEIPAVITKAQIPELGAMVGQANAQAIYNRSTGRTYVPRSQVFLGFAGSIDTRDRLYHGVFCFEPAHDDEVGDCFDRLPQATDGQPAVIQEHESPEEEADNGS